MPKLFNKRGGVSGGFTLIELLVVIAIIGVLASIVLASLNNARRKSRDARRITDIKQIQLALELFFDGAGAGQYPASTITCAHVSAGATDGRGLDTLQTNGYIPQVPRDPNSSAGTPNCYLYASGPAPITTYHLANGLEDANNPALNGDKDCNSTLANNCVNGVGAFTNGFDGTAAGRYDVIP